MAKSKLYSFFKRLATSLVLIPLVIGSILYGSPLILVLAMLAIALLSWEWASMVPNSRPAFYTALYMFCAIFTTVMAPALSHLMLPIILIVGCVLVFALALAYFKSKNETHRGLLLLGVPYISIGIGSIMAFYYIAGPMVLLCFMIAVWGVDIGGYMVGCTLKGPKLAPKTSPNKTWSGLLGGILLSLVFTYAMFWVFGQNNSALIHYMYMAAIIAVIAQIGDLIESSIKRRLGIKDSSNIIPGHGGVFDRIDGLIFAAPFAYVLWILVPYIIK